MGGYCNACKQCEGRKGDKTEYPLENDIKASKYLGYNSEFLKRINEHLPQVIKIQSAFRMFKAMNKLKEFKKYKMNLIEGVTKSKDTIISSSKNRSQNSNSKIIQDKNENEIIESKGKNEINEKYNQNKRGQKFNEIPKKSENEKIADNFNKENNDKDNDKEEQVDIEFENGIKYKGALKGGLRNGYGIQIWPEGSKYEGNWYDDKANGK